MFKSIFRQVPLRLCATVACATLACNSFLHENEATKPLSAKSSVNINTKYYPASAEFPNLKLNRNILSRQLTEALYAKLRERTSLNGYTLDSLIQVGVDNIGKRTSVGVLAGDEDSYRAFTDLLDKIIEEKHFGYKHSDVHKTNLNANELKNAKFDANFVLKLEIKAIRNVRSFCLPTFCTRGERRDLESIFYKIFFNIDSKHEFKNSGNYYPLNYLFESNESATKIDEVWFDVSRATSKLSSNLRRDWPDARGLWMSYDKSICVYVNFKDHLLIKIKDTDNDLKSTFTQFATFINELETALNENNWHFMHNNHLGYISSSPSNLGTAMKISAHLKLPNLSKDMRLRSLLKKHELNYNYELRDAHTGKLLKGAEVNDDHDTVVTITSLYTLGKSELQVAQMFADSLNAIIDVEKRIDNGERIESFL